MDQVVFLVWVEELVVKLTHPLGAWMDRMAAFDASLSDDAARDATTNMIIFPLPRAQRSWVSPAAMDHFLMEAFRCFSRKLASQPRRGWFYAWYDEASGRLHCTATLESGMLPSFVNASELVDAPSRVSEAALGTQSAIQADGLNGEAGEKKPPRAVFARPLIA